MDTIQEIKNLEKEFNSKLKKLADKIPETGVHVASFWHPKHTSDKYFITIWGHNKSDSSQDF